MFATFIERLRVICTSCINRLLNFCQGRDDFVLEDYDNCMGNAPTNAVDVAKFILHLSKSEPERTPITPLQLQKLVYYAQGWSLAKRGRKAYSEKTEAWTNGPVVDSLYQKMKSYGESPISLDEAGIPDSLSKGDQLFLRCVWETYKSFSAGALWTKTHRERPYIDARQGLGPNERSRNEITPDALKEFFTHESKDSVEFHNEGDWSGVPDDLVGSAQSILARYAVTFEGLAK